jgi:hypothetical protein
MTEILQKEQKQKGGIKQEWAGLDHAVNIFPKRRVTSPIITLSLASLEAI